MADETAQQELQIIIGTVYGYQWFTQLSCGLCCSMKDSQRLA